MPSARMRPPGCSCEEEDARRNAQSDHVARQPLDARPYEDWLGKVADDARRGFKTEPGSEWWGGCRVTTPCGISWGSVPEKFSSCIRREITKAGGKTGCWTEW